MDFLLRILKTSVMKYCDVFRLLTFKATMRAIKATIELKKTQGQDAVSPVDPEKCTVAEEHLQGAFAEVYRKVKGERVLPTAEKPRTSKKPSSYFTPNNDDGLDLD